MSNQGTRDWHVAVWMQLLNPINQCEDRMCRRKRKRNTQLVNWQFPPLYDSGTAPTLGYKRVHSRTIGWLETERELFTQGDPEQVPIIIINDYKKERNDSEFICREYVFLIHQVWNQTKRWAMF